MTETPDGWEGILAPGETIIWQGQPDAGIVWRDLISGETLMGVPFTAFAVVWVTMASTKLGSETAHSGGAFDLFALVFPLFGVPFILVGLYMLIGRILWDAYLRSQTWYTLTDTAAYVATGVFGRRRLKRYGFDAMIDPELEDDQPGTVWFASEIQLVHSGGGDDGPRRTHARRVKRGFRRLPDAREVYRLIVRQRAAARQAGND